MLLCPNLFGYLVLCFNLVEHWHGSFELTISSDKKVKGVRDNQKCVLKLMNESKPIGAIMPKNSGGHLNSSEFLFNPSYQILVEGGEGERVVFFAELIF